MKRIFWLAIASAGALWILPAQDARINILKGTIYKLALPEFRGAGDAQKFMATFNETLNRDLSDCGYVDIQPRTSYPLFVPQQPSDFQRAMSQVPQPGGGGGRWMLDWSGPPVQADYLAYGFTAAQNGVLVLQGYLSDLRKDTGTAT